MKEVDVLEDALEDVLAAHEYLTASHNSEALEKNESNFQFAKLQITKLQIARLNYKACNTNLIELTKRSHSSEKIRRSLFCQQCVDSNVDSSRSTRGLLISVCADKLRKS